MNTETKIYNPNNAWDDAANPPITSNTIWGKVYVDCQYWYLSGNGVKPEPYDPQNPEHAKKRPTTKITMQLASLSEMKLTFEQKLEFFNFSNDYKKIVLPSINALNLTKDGGNPLKALNEKWVKIRKVEGFTPNRKNPERGNYQTWVFEKAFADENACRSDYLANANREDAPWDEEQTDSEAQPAVHNDLKKQTFEPFVRIFIDEACKTLGTSNKDAIIGYLHGKFAQNPDIGNYFMADSQEVSDMIDEWLPEGMR